MNDYAGDGGNTNLTRTYAPSKFNHASAIAPLRGGTIVAFYSGIAECHDSQRVWLFYNDRGGKTYDPIHLEGLTGNPVFLPWHGRVKIIYSKFEKLVDRRVEWWQHCSLWEREVDFDPKTGEIKTSEPQPLNSPLGEGYLPRCNPIVSSDGYLLPLYREEKPYNFYGTILHSYDGISWAHQGDIGVPDPDSADKPGEPTPVPCIQPTLWQSGDVTHSLLRNFTRYGKRYALHSTSKDNGKTWSKPTNSAFYNANNSILAIECPDKDRRKKQVLVVWNDDISGRNNITLGTIDGLTIARLDRYGSYPAACVDGDKLHITWTAMANKLKFPYAKSVIKHVEYDLNSVIRYASSNWGLGQAPKRGEVDELYQT